MADTLDKLGFAFLLMSNETVKAPLLQTLNSQTSQINKICAPPKK
jgi:hypothetical protein